MGGGNTSIIGKYILKSISEKKLRTALIILSIAVSASLYFASIGISDTMVKVQTQRWRANVGYTDILVQAWWESPTRYVSPERIDDMKEYFEYAIGTVSGYGLYECADKHNQGFSLWGIGYEELNRIVQVKLLPGADIASFQGRKIIVSSYTADKFKLAVGDMVPLTINGSKQKFKVSGIAQRTGPFIGDGETVCGIVPMEELQGLYNVRGKVDALYIKLKNPANKPQMLTLISSRYPKYNVKEPFTEKEIRSQNSKVKMPFLALTIILSFMSIYIIHSTFKVITFERIPDIGTFRSIGARKSSINRMLLLESLLYGVSGGALGCLLGVAVLYLMSIFTMPSWDAGYQAAIAFDPMQLLITFLIAVALCIISSIAPIIKVSKIPVKNIILNAVNDDRRNRAFRVIVGGLLIGFGVLAPLLMKGNYSIYINTICIVAVIAAIVMLIPLVVKVMIRLLETIYGSIFGNEGLIAVKNLRDNRSVNGSISLLAIGISCVLFVNTLSYSTLKELLNYYDRNTYEIYMSAKNVDMAYLQEIRNVQGVKEVYKVTGIGGIEIVNKKDVIGLTEGVEPENYLEYNNLQMSGDRTKQLELMEKGRGILVTKHLRDRYELKRGDTLTLRAWGRRTDYTVVGFFNSIENNGNFALISRKHMKLDMGWSDDFYSTLFIKTKEDPEKVVENLKTRFAKQQPYIITMREMKKENLRYNEQLFLIAKGFSIITMLAGVLGIFNNLIINFIQRKRHLAMVRSVGMSKGQMIKMIFVEAFTMGLTGSMMGILSGVLMIMSGAGLLRALEMETYIHYSAAQLILCLFAGIVISVAASIWPALKSSKLNLMEAIKYE